MRGDHNQLGTNGPVPLSALANYVLVRATHDDVVPCAENVKIDPLARLVLQFCESLPLYLSSDQSALP